jgi:transcriptional regulator with XRE-family HTH domain
MSFGQRLIAAMEAAGLSKVTFADKMGVKKPTVSGWVSDAHGMSTDHMKRAAKLLDVTLEELAGWAHESLLEELGVKKPGKR